MNPAAVWQTMKPFLEPLGRALSPGFLSTPEPPIAFLIYYCKFQARSNGSCLQIIVDAGLIETLRKTS